MSSTFNLILTDRHGNSQKGSVEMKPQWNLKALKSAVQSKFSIPTFSQDLYYESTQLQDETDLATYRFQEGDTFHVRYDSPADIIPVQKAVESLRELAKFLEDDLEQQNTSAVLLGLLHANVLEVNHLVENYFNHEGSKNFYINMQLFIDYNGVDLGIKSHSALLLRPWQSMPIPLKTLEVAMLILWAEVCCMCDAGVLRCITQMTLGSLRKHTLRMGALDDTTRNAVQTAIQALYK